MSSPVAKKMKSTKVSFRDTVRLSHDSRKIIGTHSGTFHCDEALAVFMLRQTDEYKDADVVRTRDPAKLAPLDIVVDVGGVYSPTEHRYDHHQRGFTEVFGHGFNTKLSSAGLVYKHFGKSLIAKHLNLDESDPNVEILWLRLYSELIESVDAIDNGINITEGELKYAQRSDLSSRVKRINPNWNEPSTDAVLDQKFEQASAVTGEEFISHLDYYGKAWLPARDIVKAAAEPAKRLAVDESGAVIVFQQSCPWKDHLFALEPELEKTPSQILYVLYPENEEATAKWRIQCVPESAESFTNRKSLPEAWRGVRDEALSQVAGIEGCTFCHASGFIGGANTYEGVLAMARKAIAA